MGGCLICLARWPTKSPMTYGRWDIRSNALIWTSPERGSGARQPLFRDKDDRGANGIGIPAARSSTLQGGMAHVEGFSPGATGQSDIRTPELGAVGPRGRPLEGRAPLGQRPLVFSQGAEHSDHHSACDSGGIDAVGDRHQRHAAAGEGLFKDNVSGPPSMPGVMSSPRPTPYDPQSQAMSPCRGSDPDSRGAASSP